MSLPDAIKPPPGNPRFPLVDGLRATAALSVLVTHTALTTLFVLNPHFGQFPARLDVGVTLFFVISGFLLYRPFVGARIDGRPKPNVRRYMRRRAIRIVPAYWLALTILALFPEQTGVQDVFTANWWRYYGFVQNLDVDTIIRGIGPAWSLCVEVEFYLLMPVYALLMTRWLHNRRPDDQVRIELWVLAGLAVVSLIIRMVAFFNAPFIGNSTILGTFTWFACGMAMAVLSARWHATPVADRPRALRAVARHPGRIWLLALALFILVAEINMPIPFFGQFTWKTWLAGHVLYAAIAACFAAPAMLGIERERTMPAVVLSLRPVVWLGLISYAIFLWHNPLISVLHHAGWSGDLGVLPFTTIAFVITVPVAALSYYLVERPLLRFKDPRPDKTRPPSGSSARTLDDAAALADSSPSRL